MRAAVLTAVEDLIVESGLGAVELTAVADRAGVARSTVYRRWGTVAALLAELLRDMAATSEPRADTGTLRGDLLANAELVRRTLSNERQGPLFRALLAGAASDSESADALARFYRHRVTEWSACVIDGVRRGEVPTGTDAAAVVRAVSAPLYYQWLITGTPLKRRDAVRAADAALAAADAGVFAVRGRPHPGSD